METQTLPPSLGINQEGHLHASAVEVYESWAYNYTMPPRETSPASRKPVNEIYPRTSRTLW